MQALKNAYLTTALGFPSILAFPIVALAISESAARIKATVTDERDLPYHECRVALLNPDDKQVLTDKKVSGGVYKNLYVGSYSEILSGADRLRRKQRDVHKWTEAAWRV